MSLIAQMKAAYLLLAVLLLGLHGSSGAAVGLEEVSTQNSSAIDMLEQLLARQKIIQNVNELKEAVEHLHLKSSTENGESKESTIFDIRIEPLPQHCQSLEMPSNCDQATACTKRSGFYRIRLPQFSNESFLVQCDAHTLGGSWSIIQRRQDGSVDFYRPWVDYEAGFGDVDGEFFIGLEKLHALTSYDGPQELLVLMELSVNNTSMKSAYAIYDSFAIGSKCDKYLLKRIGRYSGTAGDSLQRQINSKFSTKDQDNDKHATQNCAELYTGGWWYSDCHWSNLNGHYGDAVHGKGINWYTFAGHTTSLKFVQMMIRRKKL